MLRVADARGNSRNVRACRLFSWLSRRMSPRKTGWPLSRTEKTVFFSISPPVESERPSASQGIPVVFTLCATGLTGPTQVQSRGVFPGREEMAEALSLIGAFVALSYASRWLE